MSWLKGKAHPGWASPSMRAEPFFVEILFPCLQFRESLAVSPGHLQQKLTWRLSWPATACATFQTQFTNLARRAWADTALETQVTGKSYGPGRAAAVLFSYWSSSRLPITFVENIFQQFSKKGSMGGKWETLPILSFLLCSLLTLYWSPSGYRVLDWKSFSVRIFKGTCRYLLACNGSVESLKPSASSPFAFGPWSI